MDPTLFLASQTLQHLDGDRASRTEIEAFYDQHGLDRFAALLRWYRRLCAAWMGILNRRDRPVDFAQNAHRG